MSFACLTDTALKITKGYGLDFRSHWSPFTTIHLHAPQDSVRCWHPCIILCQKWIITPALLSDCSHKNSPHYTLQYSHVKKMHMVNVYTSRTHLANHFCFVLLCTASTCLGGKNYFFVDSHIYLWFERVICYCCCLSPQLDVCVSLTVTLTINSLSLPPPTFCTHTHTHMCANTHTFVDTIAHDGPTLSRACLTIGKECGVVALPSIVQNPLTKVVVHTFLEVKALSSIILLFKKRLKI